jgi:hypothetical protein
VGIKFYALNIDDPLASSSGRFTTGNNPLCRLGVGLGFIKAILALYGYEKPVVETAIK